MMICLSMHNVCKNCLQKLNKESACPICRKILIPEKEISTNRLIMELLSAKGPSFENEMYAHLRNLDYRQKLIHERIRNGPSNDAVEILLTESKRIDSEYEHYVNILKKKKGYWKWFTFSFHFVYLSLKQLKIFHLYKDGNPLSIS